jgi:hypothetical protein
MDVGGLYSTVASSPSVLGVRCTPYVSSSPICVYNAWFHCAVDPSPPRCSVTLAQISDAPELDELAVLDVLSTPLTCYFRLSQLCGVRADLTCRCRQAWYLLQARCDHCLSWLCVAGECVAPRKIMALLSFYYFLQYFTSYSYLDSILSPLIIRHCFKID